MMPRFIPTPAGHNQSSRPLSLSVRTLPGQSASRVWSMLRDGFIALVITALFTVIANA